MSQEQKPARVRKRRRNGIRRCIEKAFDSTRNPDKAFDYKRNPDKPSKNPKPQAL